MSNKSGVAPEVISVPEGGGAISGMGETFSPDLFTGTGNFSVPIALPPGRNGFQPDLSLVYSTGNGSGPFGLGWGLSVPGVMRKTAQGLPKYTDSLDTFVLSGAEDLVPVPGGPAGAQRYRPRTEGLFARIDHVKAEGDDYWQVTTKDGITSLYGTPGAAGSAPAAIVDPGDPTHIYGWKLTRTTDLFGNHVLYLYERDAVREDGPHRWDQIYLSEIKYVDYDDNGTTAYLVSVRFVYETRPDPFSDRRGGFEVRTTRRCTRIDIATHAGQERIVRRYHLTYVDQSDSSTAVPTNGTSVLHQVMVEGVDGTETETLPPLTFDYSPFDTGRGMKLHRVEGQDFPRVSLGHPALELADLFGRGLPDLIELSPGVARYWKNRGGGQFDLPRRMKDAPAGLWLGEPGVQLLDADGDGRIDLMVHKETLAGYFPLSPKGGFDREGFVRYDVAPSFDLADPEVKLVDLDGDGMTDAIRSGARLEVFFQDPRKGWDESRRLERGAEAPDVSFSDPRVRWADMTGDGLQDIVLVSQNSISYFPGLGRGRFGPRVTMRSQPKMPAPFDPQRVLLGDVDGDGVTDVIYLGDGKTTIWLNKSGYGFSEPIEIRGLPPVSDMDAVRVVDLLGTGIAGLLFSSTALQGRPRWYYLELTHGKKPYLLESVANGMGALTRVGYAPSTQFLLADDVRPETRWKTTLPMPVQVVARVEVIDLLSKGKLTTEYRYRHGYWDGGEREFRGFARVEQRDTETFEAYSEAGLHPGAEFEPVPYASFSPPTETRTWFHLGPVGPEHGDWSELDLSAEYWSGDTPYFQRPLGLRALLEGLPRRERRDAIRALRGSILRSELYALDATPRRELPYTVTESATGLREEAVPTASEPGRKRIFFAHALGSRTTQWERGSDPMTSLSFVHAHDTYGQPLAQSSVAVPRGRDYRASVLSSEPFLAAYSETTYAQRDDTLYMVDRVSSTTSWEIVNDGTMKAAALAEAAHAGTANLSLMGHALQYYDGSAFAGLPFGELGSFGALIKTETLVASRAMLEDGYRSGATATNPPEFPPYLEATPSWTGEYPDAFQSSVPTLGGYLYGDGTSGPRREGYYAQTMRRKYDFHDAAGVGLVLVERDPIGNDTTIAHDSFQLLPTEVNDAVGLVTTASYDYRLLTPSLMTDPNGNRTLVSYRPTGLVASTAVMGKTTETVGDTPEVPSVVFSYDLDAFIERGEPASVRTTRRLHHTNDTDVSLPERDDTIESVAYSDGFGRIIQTRTQAEDVVFGGSTFGDAGLSADQTASVTAAVGISDTGRVVVSGWKRYDNKGRVVERYEPFFSSGWDLLEPTESEKGQKVRMHYDPRGQVLRTVFPDGSEQRVVYGVPASLGDPDHFAPTPWESTTYDQNDSAGRTHPVEAAGYSSHWNTPASATVDALGRVVEAIARNGSDPDTTTGDAYRTAMTYDVRGNVLTVSDPAGRVCLTQVYDLADRVLRTESIDAGIRRSVFDAAGRLVEGRDEKGAIALSAYDALSRPIRLWARDVTAEPVTFRHWLVYGDSADSGLTATAAAAENLLGRPYRQYDEAGRMALDAYDFKGNLTDKARRTIADDVILTAFDGAAGNDWVVPAYRVDWEPPLGTSFEDHETALLESTSYETSSAYDAAGRVKRITLPEDADAERKVLVPTYNRAGALSSVELDGDTYVEAIAYNAKGQRLLVAYGNGTMTRYVYDEETFRIVRLRTEKFSTSDGLTYTPTATSDPHQDYAYAFDLAGSILSIVERVPDTGIPNSPGGSDALERLFEYDPIYRLSSATGREHTTPLPNPWDPSPRGTDPTQTRAYTQDYTYDRAGNLTELSHTASGASFTRAYPVVSGTNRLEKMTVGSTDYDISYDAAGNITSETTSRHLEWDYASRLRVYRTQVSGSEPSVHAHYLYDAGGQRVKKLTRKQGGNLEVTLYIDGIFEHDRHVSGTTTTESDTLHVLDGASRIATRRVGAALGGDPTPAVKYHLGDHLGSSHVVLDDTGSMVNREEYSPYGETSFGSYGKKRYRFTGKERDEESGLSYHGARYYAPWLGRWTAADPAGLVDGPNLYQYVRGSPIVLNDPTGMYFWDQTSGQVVEKYHQALQSRLSSLEAKVQTSYEKERWSASDWEAFESLGATRAALREFDEMAASDTVYRVTEDNLGDGLYGLTTISNVGGRSTNQPENQVATIVLNSEYSDAAVQILGHEMYHLYGYVARDEGLPTVISRVLLDHYGDEEAKRMYKDLGTWDSPDEQAAYRREARLFGTSLGSHGDEKIDHRFVMGRGYSDLATRTKRQTGASPRLEGPDIYTKGSPLIESYGLSHRQYSENRVREAATAGGPIPSGVVLFSGWEDVYRDAFLAAHGGEAYLLRFGTLGSFAFDVDRTKRPGK